MEKSKQPKKKFSYCEQHAVIVRVENEQEQKKVFEKLKAIGFKKLKVVSV